MVNFPMPGRLVYCTGGDPYPKEATAWESGLELLRQMFAKGRVVGSDNCGLYWPWTCVV